MDKFKPHITERNKQALFYIKELIGYQGLDQVIDDHEVEMLEFVEGVLVEDIEILK